MAMVALALLVAVVAFARVTIVEPWRAQELDSRDVQRDPRESAVLAENAVRTRVLHQLTASTGVHAPSQAKEVPTLPGHLREPASRWLPIEMHDDIGLVGAAKVLDELNDEVQSAKWIARADLLFDELVQEIGLHDPDEELLAELRRIDDALMEPIRQTKRQILSMAMALSIEVVMEGKDIQVRPRDFRSMASSAADLAELESERQRMLETAFPDFQGSADDLTYVSVGGKSPGIGRVIPLNRRDHHAYFALRDDLVRYHSQRRTAWRTAIEQHAKQGYSSSHARK